MDRDDQSGLPKQLIQCPTGARITSDSCKKARCEYVFIPLRDENKQIHPSENHFLANLLLIIFVLIVLKYLVFFCSCLYNLLSQLYFIY
jgi:hypothetical protein